MHQKSRLKLSECTILLHSNYIKKTTQLHCNSAPPASGKKKRTLRCVFKSCFTFPVVCLSP